MKFTKTKYPSEPIYCFNKWALFISNQVSKTKKPKKKK